MKIALASPLIPDSLSTGLDSLRALTKAASSQHAKIVCFPESFLPGYPGMGYSVEDRTEESLKNALNDACIAAAENDIAIILPMDYYLDEVLHNLAFVIDSNGDVIGYQTKNQLDPSEDNIWTAGENRQLFEIDGLKFGITICHEGFRYPESVRWAACNDAQIVFHPHFSGGDDNGLVLEKFGDISNPYYEKAMLMRALENTIYFASVNYASKFTESASAVINPEGSLLAHQPYGVEGVLVVDIDLTKATGLLAKRFKPQLFVYYLR
ncbi:carbon-nitrogen hydrolase family protein [Sphingobacterium corticis]|uniref:Carbon-nitrogen hydrolase family protein n=1 Tax=Sphingobacterium corticis TaxID=1812823 RepID=A0ABW5NE50_9SPHI